MTKCKLCGNNKLHLPDENEYCEACNRNGRQLIYDTVFDAANSSDLNIENLETELYRIARIYHVREHESCRESRAGWLKALRVATIQKQISRDKYVNLQNLTRLKQMSRESYQIQEVWLGYRNEILSIMREQEEEAERLAQRAKKIKREAAERNKKRDEEKAAREKREAQQKFVNHIWIGLPFQSNVSEAETPFNLQKSERLVWAFAEAQYLIEQSKFLYDYDTRQSTTKYYFRLVERGDLGVTTKHIYFVGDKHRFRIRFDRIVAFEEYPDGVGLNRARQDAVHEKFVTDEGWFTYKLVTTLARLHSQTD